MKQTSEYLATVDNQFVYDKGHSGEMCVFCWRNVYVIIVATKPLQMYVSQISTKLSIVSTTGSSVKYSLNEDVLYTRW